MRRVLVSAALAAALLVGGAGQAWAAPPDPTPALDAGWSVTDGQLTWRAESGSRWATRRSSSTPVTGCSAGRGPRRTTARSSCRWTRPGSSDRPAGPRRRPAPRRGRRRRSGPRRGSRAGGTAAAAGERRSTRASRARTGRSPANTTLRRGEAAGLPGAGRDAGRRGRAAGCARQAAAGPVPARPALHLLQRRRRGRRSAATGRARRAPSRSRATAATCRPRSCWPRRATSPCRSRPTASTARTIAADDGGAQARSSLVRLHLAPLGRLGRRRARERPGHRPGGAPGRPVQGVPDGALPRRRGRQPRRHGQPHPAAGRAGRLPRQGALDDPRHAADRADDLRPEPGAGRAVGDDPARLRRRRLRPAGPDVRRRHPRRQPGQGPAQRAVRDRRQPQLLQHRVDAGAGGRAGLRRLLQRRAARPGVHARHRRPGSPPSSSRPSARPTSRPPRGSSSAATTGCGRCWTAPASGRRRPTRPGCSATRSAPAARPRWSPTSRVRSPAAGSASRSPTDAGRGLPDHRRLGSARRRTSSRSPSPRARPVRGRA